MPGHGRPHAVSSGGPPSAPRRAALAFILVTVTLDMLAFGIVIPVLPKLVLDFTGGSATSAAWWQGVFGTVFAVIEFCGFWGVWSAAAQTILSKTVAATEQGRLQGALASVRAACQVLL